MACGPARLASWGDFESRTVGIWAEAWTTTGTGTVGTNIVGGCINLRELVQHSAGDRDGSAKLTKITFAESSSNRPLILVINNGVELVLLESEGASGLWSHLEVACVVLDAGGRVRGRVHDQR
jgi:hypothetical protein